MFISVRADPNISVWDRVPSGSEVLETPSLTTHGVMCGSSLMGLACI